MYLFDFSKSSKSKLILLIYLTFIASSAAAHVNYPNQNKTVTAKFIGYSSEAIRPDDFPGIIIIRFFNENNNNDINNILIEDEQNRIPRVTLPNKNVVFYIDEKGNKLIDSLDVQKSYKHRNLYFNIYEQQGVVWTKNLTEHTTLYYNRIGYDSLKLTYNNRGSLIKKYFFNQSGVEQSTRVYSDEGILELFDSLDNELKYSNGILESSCTYINVNVAGRVKCLRNYYENGVLKSEKFFRYTQDPEIPHLKWRYYNANGTLKRIEQKSTKIKYGTGYGPVEAPPIEDKIFTTVEQHPEYPGGMAALQQYIEKWVTGIVYKEEEEISCNCKIMLQVNEDGTATFINATGDLSRLRTLGRMIAEMPKWKSGRFNGQNTKTTLVIQVAIR